MATAKIQTAKGFRVDFFAPLRKNSTQSLTVWIGGTDIGWGLFAAGRCAILKQILFSMNFGEDLSWGFLYNF